MTNEEKEQAEGEDNQEKHRKALEENGLLHLFAEHEEDYE